MLNLIIMIISIAIALLTLGWAIALICKLLSIKKRFNTSVVLVPIYARSKWPYFIASFLFVCTIVDVVLMAILKAYVVGACVLVVTLSLIALVILMITFRCAVLDKGIVIQYKFIEWSNFYDYKIKDDTIIFCGDKNGFDTLTASTTKFVFDEKNKEKLIQILEQYKNNK